jgi:hypothetical protein
MLSLSANEKNPQPSSMRAESAPMQFLNPPDAVASLDWRQSSSLRKLWWYGLSGRPANGPYGVFPAIVLLVFSSAMLAPIAPEITNSEFNR